MSSFPPELKLLFLSFRSPSSKTHLQLSSAFLPFRIVPVRIRLALLPFLERYRGKGRGLERGGRYLGRVGESFGVGEGNSGEGIAVGEDDSRRGTSSRIERSGSGASESLLNRCGDAGMPASQSFAFFCASS